MSQNPQHPDSYQQPEQVRLPNYTAQTSVQFPSPPQPYYSQTPPMTSALHEVPVSLPAHNAPPPPPLQPMHRPQFAVFDPMAAPQTQTNDLYSHTPDNPQSSLVPQPSHAPQNLPPSSHAVHLNNPADLYSYQGHSKPQYATQMWQQEQSRHEANTAALQPQLAPPPREQPFAPPPPQSIGYSSTLGSGVTRKRERPIDPVFSQPVPHETVMAATTATLSDEGPSIDTRKGKERVQRPCTNCGEMNHIRKNKCWKCDKPKEPAKKRTKRVRRKKKMQVPMQTLHPVAGAPSALNRTIMQPEMNSISVDRAESLVRVPFPPQEEIPSMFDSRNFGVIPGSQQQGLPHAGIQQPHAPLPPQRGVREFTEGTTFDDGHGSLPQSHQVDREFR